MWSITDLDGAAKLGKLGMAFGKGGHFMECIRTHYMAW